MRNFLRTLKYAWPYRGRLLASFACALVVAALWSLNLSAIYPVLKILSTDKNLQQWVDEEIDRHQRQLDDPSRSQARLDHLKGVLKDLDANPNQPNAQTKERKTTEEIAKVEGERSS